MRPPTASPPAEPLLFRAKYESYREAVPEATKSAQLTYHPPFLSEQIRGLNEAHFRLRKGTSAEKKIDEDAMLRN